MNIVITLTHEKITKNTKPMVIKAFATWCPHCAKMKPIFEQLEKELGSKYMFTEFDVDEAKELTQQFSIQSLPTFVFLKNNKEVSRVIGEMSAEDLKKAITQSLG
jgi:thioredoxin 1